jgi:protein TonB
MWAPEWYESAHEQLKRKYGKYMFVAALAALVLTGMGAAFAPPYVPTPYQLRERKVVSVEVPDDITIPPPPKNIATPELPTAFEASDDATAEETIAPTDFNPFQPPALPSAPSGPEDFFAFDAPPVPVQSEAAEYPELARQAEAEGTVEVLVTIDEHGRVIAVEIYSSDTIEACEKAAMAAARKWLFQPAKQRDVPVKCKVVIPFSFVLG